MCARYVADQNCVKFLYESGTYANTSGAGQWIGLVSSHEITDSENVNSIRYVCGGNRNVDIFVDGARDVEGTITYNPQDFKFLAFALGSNVDAGSPSPYTHTISEVNSNNGNAFTSGTLNPFISFTMEDAQVQADGENFVRTVKGCMVNSFELSASEGEIVECNVNYIGQTNTFSSGNATAVTAATLRPFLWQDVQVSLPSGTAIDEIKSIGITINNNIERRHYLNGSRDTAVPIPLNRDYEVSLTLDGTSERTKTLYDQYFRGGSNFNMMVSVVDSSAGAGSRDAYMVFSGCRITEMSAPTPNEGVDEQTITIMPKSCSAVINDTTQLYNIF